MEDETLQSQSGRHGAALRKQLEAMEDATPLQALVGRQSAELRKRAGVTQEAVAREAKSYGLAWNRAKVALLEAGGKHLSAEDLLALVVVLSVALDRPVSLHELLPDQAQIALNPALTAPSETVKRLLAGESSAVYEVGLPINTQQMLDAHSITSPIFLAEAERVFPGCKTSDLVRALQGISEAEEKAARRLGVRTLTLCLLADRLWHRTLTAERDRLVAEKAAEKGAKTEPRSAQALRGHVTRHLMAQLREALDLANREQA